MKPEDVPDDLFNAFSVAWLESFERGDDTPIRPGLAAALTEYETQIKAERDAANATITRVREFAKSMRGWCSPYGVAADYATRLEEVLGVSGCTEPRACCDLHGIHCEPPSELCCHACTEAAHPEHPPGVRCVLDASDDTPRCLSCGYIITTNTEVSHFVCRCATPRPTLDASGGTTSPPAQVLGGEDGENLPSPEDSGGTESTERPRLMTGSGMKRRPSEETTAISEDPDDAPESTEET